MSEVYGILEYTFVGTEKGNFVITSKEVQDNLESLLGGFTYGDNVAATGVFYVGEENLPTKEDFADYSDALHERFSAGEDVSTASTRTVKGHKSLDEVAEQHTLFRALIQTDPEYFIKGVSEEEQLAELITYKERNFSDFLDAVESVTEGSAKECGCDDCKDFLSELDDKRNGE